MADPISAVTKELTDEQRRLVSQVTRIQVDQGACASVSVETSIEDGKPVSVLRIKKAS